MRIPETCPLPAGSTVWAYLRDSGGPAQDRSVEQQLDVLRRYCTRHNLVLQQVFQDAARQGDNADARDGLNELLDLARSAFPQIHDRRTREQRALEIRHGIIFWTYARLGRDRIEAAWIRNDLRMRGLIVTSLADDVLTGNSTLDPILEELIAFKNELDLEVISREAKRGLHQVVTMRDTNPSFLQWNPGWQPTGRYLGIFPGRAAPAGFRFEKIQIGLRRDGRPRIVQRLVVDDVTWPRALLAWRMRVQQRASIRQIHAATHLYRNEAGYGRFFHNPIYIGILEFGDMTYGAPDDSFVEPLIPIDWFELEQERSAKRAVRRKKGGTHQPGDIDPRHQSNGRLLSGLLVCARCGSRLHAESIPAGTISTTGKQRKAWPFYWCSAAKKKECDAGKISASRLEPAIIERLQQNILTVEHLREYADSLLSNVGSHRRELLEALDALECALVEAKRKTDHIADALSHRPASPTLLQRLDEAEAQQQSLTREIQTRQSELAYWASFEVDEFELARISQRVSNALASGDTNRARYALATFITRIVVDSGRNLIADIYLKFPHPGSIDEPISMGIPLHSTRMRIRRRPKKQPQRNGRDRLAGSMFE